MSKIVQSTNFSDLLDHVDGNTLLVLDVDDTLIRPVNYVGGTSWFKHKIKMFASRGLGELEAVSKIYPVFVQLQQHLKIKTVENNTAEVVEKAQGLGNKTIALTWRGDALAARTAEQLQSLGIYLNQNTIYDEEVEVVSAARFVRGVLSVNPGHDKGPTLEKFLSQVNYAPKKVVFVDDDIDFVQDVKGMLEKKNIEHTCIRYGGADSGNAKFDAARADSELRDLFTGTAHEKIMEGVF